MAELSYFWNDNGVGDASESPYSDYEFLSQVFRFALTYDRATEGVIDTGDPSYAGGLVVNGGAGQVTVQTGVAIVDGTFYKNSAAVNVAIATPAVSTRVDRIVLRKDFAAQTVRITRIAGTEGAGAPAITQTDTVIWDIKLAQVSITTGGVITVTQEAVAVRTPLGPGYQYDWFDGSTDNTWATPTATPESIGASGVKISCGPGKWMFWGQLQFSGTTTTGARFAYVTIAGSTAALTRHDVTTNQLSQIKHIAIAPFVANLATTSEVELKFLAGDAADIVYGSTDDFAITTIVGIRVI